MVLYFMKLQNLTVKFFPVLSFRLQKTQRSFSVDGMIPYINDFSSFSSHNDCYEFIDQ